MDKKIKQIIKKYHKVLLPVIKNFIKNKKIIDVGCGNGLNSLIFNKKLNSNITLVDKIDIRSKDVLHFPFFKASIENLPFKNTSFDVAFVQYVLHHLTKRIKIEKALKELKRIAKKIIIVEELFTKKTNQKKAKEFDLKMNKIIHPNVKMPTYKYYTDKELKEIFIKENLTIIKEKILSKGNKTDGFLLRKIYILK